MSEFIAEAQVLITPNVATFAATLRKQVEAAVVSAGPVAIPVIAAPAAGSTAALIAAQQQATTATLGLSAATGLEAESLDLAAKAQLDAAAAAQLAGAAATAEATEIARLTVAENAAAVAFRKSEAVALAAVGTTSELAAARATLKAATSATVANELALDAALATTSVGHKNAAAGALLEARTLEASAKASFDSARAHRVDAVATAESAAAHAQLSRGAAASALSMVGLRGATLAASAPFIAGAASVIIFSKAIKAASDETEELNKSAVVFGSSSEEIRKFAESSANSLGISATQALRATGIFGNLFRTIQISQPVSAAMSEQLVRLASDLSSFNNADPSRTLEALRSGLVGQARPLRVFGIFLSQARAQQEALTETGKKNVKQLTNAELVTARYNIILRDGAIANNDFANTSDRMANQGRILSANIENLSAELGQTLVPTLTLAVRGINDLLGGTQSLIIGLRGLRDQIQHSGFAEGFNKDVESGTTRISHFFLKVRDGIPFLNELKGDVQGLVPPEVTASMKRLAEAAGGLGEASRDAAPGVGLLADSIDKLKQASQQVTGLEFGQLKIQTGLAPGGRGAEEANLKQQIEEQKRVVALTVSGTKARREALQQLKQKQDQLAALQDQDAQDARDRASKIKSAAAKAKAAARAAATAQQEATQAFIDSFAGRQQQLQNKLTDAQLFGSARQEINLNKQIVKADTAEIHAIQDRIRHLHLHGDALKVARAAIKALQQEIFNTRNAILQLQADRKQAIVDARQSHLEAQLAIAETTKSTADDRRAEKALIAFDEAQIKRLAALKKRGKATRDEIALLDQYRVDLAQRKKALDDLNKQTKDTQRSAQSLFFTFLQTQQGFASNLLGNLIPGFATAGLVGNSSAAAAGTEGLRQVAGGFEQPRGSVQSAAAVAGSRERGVRPVQVDTTNHILRQILAALQGRRVPPEITHNRQRANAAYDTLGAMGD